MEIIHFDYSFSGSFKKYHLRIHFGKGIVGLFPSFRDTTGPQDAPLSRGAVCAAAATGTAAIAKDGELFAWGYGQAPDGCRRGMGWWNL